jgi:hypothetical protein
MEERGLDATSKASLDHILGLIWYSEKTHSDEQYKALINSDKFSFELTSIKSCTNNVKISLWLGKPKPENTLNKLIVFGH